jgi:hypothetical protein
MGKGKGGGFSGGGFSGTNGGIMGSGVFGHFGSTVVCKAEDSSIYCQFVKIFNILIMFLMVIFVIYLVYTFYNLWFSSSRRGTSKK